MTWRERAGGHHDTATDDRLSRQRSSR
jgi:hypothetical protein